MKCLCHIGNIGVNEFKRYIYMAIGRSGRIVLQVDPELKKKLYSILAMESITLKDWFTLKAKEQIENKNKENAK